MSLTSTLLNYPSNERIIWSATLNQPHLATSFSLDNFAIFCHKKDLSEREICEPTPTSLINYIQRLMKLVGLTGGIGSGEWNITNIVRLCSASYDNTSLFV
jgi:hypothetical protein